VLARAGNFNRGKSNEDKATQSGVVLIMEDLIAFTFAVLIGLFAGAAFWSGSFDAAETKQRRDGARLINERCRNGWTHY